MSLAERDLDPSRGAILVRHGKGDKRREVGMDEWGWEQLRPWLDHRSQMPVGTLLCVINGPTSGRPWSGPAARTQLRPLALDAGVRRRFAPHQLRHAHAVEMAREVCRSTSFSASSTRRPRRNLRLLAGNRQHRRDQRRPLSPRADDARERGPALAGAAPDRARRQRVVRSSLARREPDWAVTLTGLGAGRVPGRPTGFARAAGLQR